MTCELTRTVRRFSGEERPKLCECKHRLFGSGAMFYQSVGLLQCANCGGWQRIKKPIK